MSTGIGDYYGKYLLSQLSTHPDILDYSPQDFKRHNLLVDTRFINTIKKAQQNFDPDFLQRQLDIIHEHNIEVISYYDDLYPEPLKNIPDAPIMLFKLGKAPLEHTRNIAIIGTRQLSEWTKSFTLQLIGELKPYHPQIVSGLAIGIDSVAHQAALTHDVPTIAVLANGLLNIYPTHNRKLARQIVAEGGCLLSEHLPYTFADKQNFPLRNRIVAGLCSMTITIESPIKGGSMITAKLAASYDREVGAVPGRPTDEKSKGCHYLIQTQIAHMITNAQDIADILQWDTTTHKPSQGHQIPLYHDLNEDEKAVIDYMQTSGQDAVHIDELMWRLNKNNTHISAVLLNLELLGYIRVLSGKRYQLT